MRIRSIALVCITGIGLLAVAGAGAISYQEWGRLAAVNEAEALVQVIGAASHFVETMALERGVYNQVIVSRDANLQEKQRLVAPRVAATDTVFRETLARLAKLPRSAVPGVRANIEEAQRLVGDARARADAVWQGSSTVPPPYAARELLSEFVKAAGILDQAIVRIERAIADRDPRLGLVIKTSQLANEMREAAGQRSTILSRYAGTRQANDVATTAKVAELTGEIHASWKRLQRIARQAGQSPKLDAAIEQIRSTFMTDGERVYARMADAARDGTSPPIEFLPWRAWTVAMLTNILAARDAPIAQALEDVGLLRRAAEGRLALALGGAGGAVLFVFGATLFLERRVLRPIGQLTTAIDRVVDGKVQMDAGLTSDDASQMLRCAMRQDEIGSLARVLDRFQQRTTEVRDLNERLDAALSNMPQGLCMFDADQQLIVCNRRFSEMYGLAPEHTSPGTSLRTILDQMAHSYAPEDAGAYVADHIAAADRNERWNSIEGLRDGRTISVSRQPMSNGGWLATHEDITEAKRREASFRLLFEANPVPMWLQDPGSLRFLAVNDAAIKLYGYTGEQFLGMTALDIRPVEERDAAWRIIGAIDGSYDADRVWRHQKADGTEIQVLPYARTLTYGGRPAMLVAVVDITERRRAEERIAHMARHDALTNLPNRVLFHERLEQAVSRTMRHNENLAVLCLDLDHFKDINDTLGHPIGDALLQAAAQRLAACVRDTDTVARLGGDEFAIVQVALARPEDASALAERIVEELSRPYDLGGHQVVIGTSVGIANAPADSTNTDQLLKQADMALYRAKADGRGTYRFFEPGMDARAQARRALELDLRKALVDGEFELHYQPIISLQTDEVTSFEALLRWNQPERGMISPAEFIPLAEEIGLITPLGEWVLREACAEAARWPGGINLAVNLSPAQFKNRNLAQAVISALAASGLAPSRLELEITETVLLQDSEATLAMLHQLRGLGVHISMDDFGTGYSSLSYLRSFPFDKIKIDQSFVRELSSRSDCEAIVRAVTGLGSSLGMLTTAEGVETEEQLEKLRAEGCTEAQGYLFSPPRPATDITRLLTSLKWAARDVA